MSLLHPAWSNLAWSGAAWYSAASMFACLALLYALVATPLFRAADTPPTTVKNRVESLDGLRGFLALAVVFHHLSVYAVFIKGGSWTRPSSQFNALLGPFGVSLFFMITGYLFWGRLLRDSGRVNWRSLYTGRLFRIGPLYLAAALVLMLIVFMHTGPHLLVPAWLLAREIVSWLSLGFFEGEPVNSWSGTILLLAGVTWTVQWEWWFYLSLPVLAVFARRPKMQMPLVLSLLAGTLALRLFRHGHYITEAIFPCCDLFLAGMLCASLGKRFRSPALPDWIRSVLLLLCLAGGFLRPTPYSCSELLSFTAAFYLITSGCTLFGLLRTRPARRLGDVSYGIYLLQGLAMAAVFRPMPLQRFAVGSALHLWALNLLCCVLLVGMATATHVWIERPGTALGRRLAKRWARTGIGSGPGPATRAQPAAGTQAALVR